MKDLTRGRGRIGLLAALLLIIAPSAVMLGVAAPPAHAWVIECIAGFDCPGDPMGGSLGLDDGNCFWDSCGDGSVAGDPDPSDECTADTCPDGQNPPEHQCDITVKDDGTIVCTVNAPGPTDPPPDACDTSGDCPDPVTEDPIDPSTCAPTDDGSELFFNQDALAAQLTPVDTFPDMDPVYNPGCPPPPLPAPAPTQFGASDVAFGDSFMSGEGVGPFVASPAGGPDVCDVANDAWTNQEYGSGNIIPAVFGTGSSKPFENWSCSGATIAQITNQINAAQQAGLTDDNVTHSTWAGLGSSTIRVQVDGGGNDVGFGNDLSCAYKIFSTPDNQNTTNGNNQPCIPPPAQFTPLANALIPRLTSLYELASGTGPSGPTVEAADYPQLFPVGTAPVCGWAQTGITRADQIRANDDTLILDDAIRRAAAAAQVHFIDFSTALQNANICSDPRGINRVRDVGTHIRGAFHPNALGHGALLTSYTRQNFFSPAGARAAVPTDGTLVGDRSGDQVYVVAGGALFPFKNQAELAKSSYKGDDIQLEPGYDVAAQEQVKPKDGTLLTDAQTGFTYVVSGGQLVPLSPTPLHLQGITVPHAALAGYVISNPPLSSGSSSPGAIGDPATGNLEVYYNSGGKLAETAYQTSTKTWINVGVIGGAITGQPSAVFDTATGNLEIYYNSGGKLAETAFVPGTGFVQAGVVGGAITGSPTALYDTGDGNLEVYYNSGGTLSETAFVPATISVPGHWVQVGAIGAAITGSPSVIVDPGDGNLEIYYNSGGVLTELAFVYASGWVHVGAIGGAITGSPKALYDPATGHLEIFSNSGGKLALTSFDFGTGKFTQTTTTDALGGDPAPVFDQQIGDVEVYYDTGGQLAYDVLSPVAGFSGPIVLGDAITADPAALFNTTSQMSEVYFSSGGQLAQDAYNPQTGTFSGLRLIGGTVSS